ncbi:MAG: hypothetical protein Q4F81_05550 [Eubacteriales bacterium]|nr:hypothetical protein [Eubacteriales bacterium]
MNQTRFQKWMNAVDDDLLEEAQQPMRKKWSWLYSAGAIAACLAVAVTAVTMTRRSTDQPVMIASPIHESSEAEFQQLGYSIPLPDSASETAYYLIDTGENDNQMAEVNFEQDGQAYYCRALKAEQPQDISGIYADWTESLDWSGEDVSVQLRKSEDAAWVGWYAPEVEVQWCVAGGSDVQVLLDTAQTIVEKLGYVMPLYPMESAEDAFADGGYSVDFTAADLVKNGDGYSLTAKIYDYDRYELEDIQSLKEGDQIEVCREPVTVESILWDHGAVIINGGIESGGVELIEHDGLYRTKEMNDQPVYYELGTITLPLSADCTFEDHDDLEQEPDGLVYEYEDVPSAIHASETPFNCYNTVITVRQEQVVQIIRYWIP